MNEHDVVALIEDRPADGLHKGDVGAVVHCYRTADVYEVEFIDEHGHSKILASIPGHQLIRLNLLSLTA
jgi:uncharacterized protein DUF4926